MEAPVVRVPRGLAHQAPGCRHGTTGKVLKGLLDQRDVRVVMMLMLALWLVVVVMRHHFLAALHSAATAAASAAASLAYHSAL